MKRKVLLTAMGILSLSGCATVGSPFEFQGPDSIVVGKTTQAQVLKRYGEPFRAGYENGETKWTYGYYHYKLFGDSETKDLTVNFNKNGIVTNYSYSSSEPEEVKKSLEQ